MKLPRINDNTRLLYSARSRKWEGGKKAVLLLHGWTGYTYNLEYLGQELNNAGYTVFAPRLPGHGTTAEDFLNTTAEMWIQTAFDAFKEIQLSHEIVCVGGQSMGALMSLLLATQFKIPKILLYAPVLVPNNKLLHLTPYVKHLVPKIKHEVTFRDTDDEERRIYKTEYSQYDYTKAGAQLLKIIKESKKQLGKVDSTILAFFSKADDAVSMESESLLKEKAKSANVTTIILEDSPHTITCGKDKEFVAERSVQFLKES